MPSPENVGGGNILKYYIYLDQGLHICPLRQGENSMDNNEKKKVFISPEAEIVLFNNEDIITLSSGDFMWWGHGGEEEF